MVQRGRKNPEPNGEDRHLTHPTNEEDRTYSLEKQGFKYRAGQDLTERTVKEWIESIPDELDGPEPDRYGDSKKDALTILDRIADSSIEGKGALFEETYGNAEKPAPLFEFRNVESVEGNLGDTGGMHPDSFEGRMVAAEKELRDYIPNTRKHHKREGFYGLRGFAETSP